MKENNQSVNKKVLRAIIAYNELSYEQLGQQCDPPVTKSAISYLLSGHINGGRLINQVVNILKPGAIALVKELESFNSEITGEEISLIPGEREDIHAD